MKNFVIEVSDYRYFYNDEDGGIYSYLEAFILFNGKRREVRIFDIPDDFEIYPVRALKFTGELYDGGAEFALTMTDVLTEEIPGA